MVFKEQRGFGAYFFISLALIPELHWQAMKPFSTRLADWFPALIAVACLLAYANSFDCPFLFDDATVITRNPHLFHLWPPWDAVLAPTRFVADYSFALNYRWSGFSPADFRLVNILIHMAAGLVLYGVVRRTLLLPTWRGRFEPSAASLAVAIALLWTVHPLQTESVTYIAQRIEALMGLFFLLTVYAFVRGATGSRVWKPAAVLFCALGMATKEIMVTAPVLLVLYDGIFLSESWRGVLRRWRWHAALFATWLVLLALLRASVARAASEHVPLVGAATIRWEYALTQLNVLVHYLKLSLIPYPLCLDYRWPLVASPSEALWPGTLTVLLAAGTLLGLWKRSWMGFLGAWFFLILAPTSSFNPLPDAAFEHRMYLPLAGVLAGLVGAFGWILPRLVKHDRLRLLTGYSLLALATLGLGLLTYARNTDYRTEETMWRDVIRKRPDNFRTYTALSAALIEESRFTEADEVSRLLLMRLPPFARMGRPEIETGFATPGHPPLPLYYAMAHNNLGLSAFNQGKSSVSLQHCDEALRVVPQAFWAHRLRGQILFEAGRREEALAEWEQAVAWNPRDALSQAFLAVALEGRHQFKEAALHYQLAVEAKPDLWFARAQWAWLLATCPVDEVRNGPLARTLATPLLDFAATSPRALDVMAAACAECGDFTMASRYAREALERATGPVAPEATRSPDEAGVPLIRSYTRQELQDRLQSYTGRQPFRSKK